jgi:hypothetical protein
MNVANCFNEDGQRVEVERLYSPFIRLLGLNHKRKQPSFVTAPRRPNSPWFDAIRNTLRGGRVMDVNTLYAHNESKGTKHAMQQQISKMKRRNEIVALGKFPNYAYRLP